MLLMKHCLSFHAPRDNESLLRVSSINAVPPDQLKALYHHLDECICNRRSFDGLLKDLEQVDTSSIDPYGQFLHSAPVLIKVSTSDCV